MTKITDIYEGGSHQLRHCDPCEMPVAMQSVEDADYSLLKHIIIETRECASDPGALQFMREQHEAQGSLPMFEAAKKCIHCAEGMCLLIRGNETGWQVGGSRAV